jgi:hypothetical protein
MNLEDYIFKDSENSPLTPQTAYNIVRYAKDKAGITKHLKLKLFRKSRVSNMMKEGCNDGAIREQIWGNQGTSMFKVYAKYSPEDIENAMLDMAGIEHDKKEDGEQIKASVAKSHKCHVCGKSNGPDAKWCPECGTPITPEAKAETDKLEAKTYAYILQRLEALEKAQQN